MNILKEHHSPYCGVYKWAVHIEESLMNVWIVPSAKRETAFLSQAVINMQICGNTMLMQLPGFKTTCGVYISISVIHWRRSWKKFIWVFSVQMLVLYNFILLIINTVYFTYVTFLKGNCNSKDLMWNGTNLKNAIEMTTELPR